MKAIPLPLGRITALASRRWFKWVGYPAYFLLCLFAFAYFTFPYERARERVRTEMETALNAEVEIDDLSPSWVTGVTLSGVQIQTRPRPGSTEKGSKVRVEHLTARVSLLSLLTGGLDLSFTADLLGGEIEGETTQDGQTAQVDLAWSDLDISQVTMVQEAIGLPVAGVLEGEAKLRLSQGTLAQAEGSMWLAGNEIVVGDGRSKLKLPGMPGDGITVDAIRVGALRGDLEVKEGVAEIQRMSSTSGDLEMIWEGTMRMRDPFPRSTLSAYVRFKFGDAYRNRSDRTKALFDMLDVVPRMRQAKRGDGFFGYRVSGSFDRGLTFNPSKRATLGRDRTTDRPSRPRRTTRRQRTPADSAGAPAEEEVGGTILGPPADGSEE